MKWLREYIDYKGISVLQFEKTIGTRSTIDKAIKNNSNLRSDMIAKIIETYSEINPIWLITGKGEMLNATTSKSNSEQDLELKTNVSEPRPDYVSKNVSGELKLKPIDDLGFDKDDPDFWEKLCYAQAETLDKYEKRIEILMKSLSNSLDEIERLKGSSEKNA